LQGPFDSSPERAEREDEAEGSTRRSGSIAFPGTRVLTAVLGFASRTVDSVLNWMTKVVSSARYQEAMQACLPHLMKELGTDVECGQIIESKYDLWPDKDGNAVADITIAFPVRSAKGQGIATAEAVAVNTNMDLRRLWLSGREIKLAASLPEAEPIPGTPVPPAAAAGGGSSRPGDAQVIDV